MTDSGDPVIRPVGDSALLIEFENRIDKVVHDQVLSLSRNLDRAGMPAIREVVSGYRALLVHYDPIKLDFGALCDAIQPLLHLASGPPPAGRHWEIPVYYGGDAAYDLGQIARNTGLGKSEIIQLHSQPVYRVYMVGFAPGWTFLGGLDPRLFTPRLETPRLEVPAGCISIGGQQTLIGGPAMPSGWNLIGQTPERTFAPEREKPFFLVAGDQVSFRPVDRDEFDLLSKKVAEGCSVSQELSC